MPGSSENSSSCLGETRFARFQTTCVLHQSKGCVPHDGADDGAVWMQGSAQALGQGLGQTEDVGGNGGGAYGGGGEARVPWAVLM